jgi:hypothetical protein
MAPINSTKVPAEARADALAFLLRSKMDNQAWFPYIPGGECSLEATAWSLIALRQEEKVSLSGLDYMAHCQNAADGGWSTKPGAGRSDWTAGPVLLCMRLLSATYPQRSTPQIKNAVSKGLFYLLDSRVEFFGPTARLLLLMSKGPEGLAYARGWPWDPSCFHWLEPTSYCLLALKLPQSPEKEEQQKVIKFADKFITEHACQGGGWNYGCEQSLGAMLPPFRLTTAEALLALQDNRSDKSIAPALAYLKGLSRQDSSSLSLAVSILALSAYDEPFSSELDFLLKRQDGDGSFGTSTLSTALAALALEAAEGTKVLKMRSASGGSPP